MITADRLWQFLPLFLRRAPKVNPTTGKASLIWSICRAVGDEADVALAAGALMRARGLAVRAYPSQFPDYYTDPSDPSDPSDARKDDLYLIGASRGLYRRTGETWFEFETRLQLFPSEVTTLGSPAGLVRDLARTGLDVELLDAADPQSWLLLDETDECAIPEDQISHLFDLSPNESEPSDPTETFDPHSVRGTRVYDGEEEYFTFIVRLTGATAYSQAEIRDILRRSKPAHTLCYCFYPGAEYAVAIP